MDPKAVPPGGASSEPQNSSTRPSSGTSFEGLRTPLGRVPATRPHDTTDTRVERGAASPGLVRVQDATGVTPGYHEGSRPSLAWYRSPTQSEGRARSTSTSPPADHLGPAR